MNKATSHFVIKDQELVKSIFKFNKKWCDSTFIIAFNSKKKDNLLCDLSKLLTNENWNELNEKNDLKIMFTKKELLNTIASFFSM
jgi:hypothetical protein